MKPIKNIVTVILDTTQENTIQIGKPQATPPSSMIEMYNTSIKKYKNLKNKTHGN